MDKKVRTSLLKYAKAHETYLLCQKISQVLIVLGIYNFGPCAENPSSLVFHAAKKRWQVYYLASRAARIIIIVQLGTEKNEPPRVQFSCGSIPTYSWVGPKIDWRHVQWLKFHCWGVWKWVFLTKVFQRQIKLISAIGTFDLTAHTFKNLIPMVVTRAMANSSKNHALLMCRSWKMG